MKKKIGLPVFWNPAGTNADELADEYSAGSSPPSTKPPRRPVAPATPAAAQGGTPAPGGAYQMIDIGPPDIDIGPPDIDIGPPDIGDIPISLGGDEPPEFHHGEEREDEKELGDPREELDPNDFEDPSDSDPSGGGGGGGGVRGGGGGGGG